MERFLGRLERRLGRYAIPNLILYVVGGMAIVWVLSLQTPAFPNRLSLDVEAVRHGQVWRLVTFLMIPVEWRPIFFFLTLYFTWWVGSSLEQQWGAFKFNAYYLLGAVATIGCAFVAGTATNVWLDVSLFLAFATLFPDVEVLLFFILPVRVKWLGIVSAGYLVFSAATGGWAVRMGIGAAVLNYGLFFGGYWRNLTRARQKGTLARQRGRRSEVPSSAPQFGQRECAMCGAREADGADIRVCSCAKCGGQQRALCLGHARSH